MSVIEIKLFITLSLLWSCSRSEFIKPRILLANGTEFSRISVLQGEPLDVYCTGQEGYELQIISVKGYNYKNSIIIYEPELGHTSDEFITTSVNKTTIRLYVEKPDEDIALIIKCHYKNYTEHRKTAYLTVRVSSLPAVKDFRCISMSREYLNCSWTSITRFIGFSIERQLYYVEDGMPKHLCTTFASNVNGLLTAYCVWDRKNPILPYIWHDINLAFSMKSCNEVGCTNQTFVFDHNAIVKLEAPTLELQYKSSYGAVLRIISDGFADEYANTKISYWYSGRPSFHNYSNPIFKTSSNPMLYDDDDDDEKEDDEKDVELKLPCANELYEVRVSVRSQLAIGEEFWSDDAVIYFVTEPAPKDVGTAVDPTCNQRRAKVTQDVMLYLIDEFFKKIKEEQNELKTKINALKLKAGIANF